MGTAVIFRTRGERFVIDAIRAPYTGLVPLGGGTMWEMLRQLWSNDEGQDVAEYALMLAVVLLIVVASVSAIGTNANTVFNSAASHLTAS